MDKINLLVNLIPGFYQTPALQPVSDRLARFAEVRRTSHDTPDQIRADLQWADCVLMWSWPVLDDALLDAAPKLRFSAQLDIGRPAAEIALRRNFPISVAKAGWSPAVAEMALTLMLNLLRRVSDYHAAMRAGSEKWVKNFPVDIDVTERQLTGRPVGIIGLGAIGRRLAELLAPFHCDLRIYDPYIPDEVVKQHGGRKVELMELCRQSDVVVVAAAAAKANTHMIGRAHIEALRKDAVFINSARAALVDTEALIDRLKKGDLFAAIDVFDKEPAAADHPLRKLPNAYLTPHRGGGLMASVDRIFTWLIDDMEAFLAGRPRKYALTAAMLPALDG